MSDLGGACVPLPEANAGNHGECVSAKAKAGVRGKDLAVFAKQVNLVGPNCISV